MRLVRFQYGTRLDLVQGIIDMLSSVGFVILCGLASVMAAPTVHLVKQEDSDGVPDYQQLLPTDLPPIVDPVWMTVTMKPLVKTTIVEPLNPQYPQPTTSEQRPPLEQPDFTPYQRPNAPTWPTQQNPSATPYYPSYYSYGTQTEGPPTQQFFIPQQYPFNVQPRQYQYPYQGYPQLTWKPATVPQPCANAASVQQAYHQYQQRGY